MLGRSAQMGTFRETIMLEGFLTPAIGYSLIWRYTTYLRQLPCSVVVRRPLKKVPHADESLTTPEDTQVFLYSFRYAVCRAFFRFGKITVSRKRSMLGEPYFAIGALPAWLKRGARLRLTAGNSCHRRKLFAIVRRLQFRFLKPLHNRLDSFAISGDQFAAEPRRIERQAASSPA